MSRTACITADTVVIATDGQLTLKCQCNIQTVLSLQLNAHQRQLLFITIVFYDIGDRLTMTQDCIDCIGLAVLL